MNENMLKLLEGSVLSEQEEVKNLFIENPDLLSYKSELEIFYSAFNDYKMFKRTVCVCKELIYMIMSVLRQRPVLIEFMKDYCKIRGEYEFSHHISIHTEDMLEYANLYVTLNDELKLVEQNDWCKRSGFKMSLNIFDDITNSYD